MEVLWQAVNTQTVAFHQCLHCLLRKFTIFRLFATVEYVMVMETPSPQCVGREFVRQYYTLLHEAPLHLHRFYSHNSSFVHGGVEKPGEEQPPVMGQGDIHKKIMSLNFRDCHAKIRQVDSQATVGNAVVVQVTGELSNNGQPMRRFMQTFVLAPQSPKKYYVHNDIFRYQDEVFHDNDTDTENQEDTVDSEADVGENPVSQTELLQEPVAQFYDQPPMSNGTGLLEEERTESPVSPKSEEIEQEVEIEQDDVQIMPTEMEALDEDKDEPKMEEYETELQVEEPAVPKPFSWAAMASKNTNNVPPMNQIMTQPPPQTNKPPPQPQGFGSRNEVKQETSPTAPQPQRAPRPSREHGGRVERERIGPPRDDGEPRGDMMGDRGRGTRFSDSQQLFVGNLPHNVSEKELRTFFGAYGTVVELRINTKAGSGKVPNFGFVVFDSPEPVQHILNNKPIKFNGEHRLNVEEKKPRGEGRPIGRGPPPRSGSAGGGGGFSRGGSVGRGNIRGGGGGGGPPGMRGGLNRGGMSGPRR